MNSITPFIQETDFHRILIENIPQAIIINQMIFNEMGEPVDYLILDANHAIEEHIVLKGEEIIGKRAKEILPDAEQEWFIRFGEAVKTGKPDRFEMYVVSFDQWFDVHVIPLGSQNKFATLFQDITELANKKESEKKALEALKKSEERYRGLFDSMSEAFELMELIYENDKPVDYIFLDVNPAWERMTGLKKEQVLGRKASEAVGLVESYWPEALDRSLRTGEMVNIENYGVALDKWYSVNVWKYSETACGVTITDITERKKAKEALQESESKYRTIFETAQEGIWVIDDNDQTILVNEKLQQMLGYSFDEMVYKSPQVYMAPEFQTLANDRLKEHMKGIKQVIDYRLIKKDGSYLWCILSSTPLFDKNGKFDGSIAMITDITERKKIEIEKDHYMKIADERAARLRAIMDLIPAGVWISDHTGKVVMVNQEAVNMYRGCSPLTGRPEEYTSYKLFLPGTDEPVTFEPYPPKEAMIGVILDFERFDGTRGTQVASTEALRDEDGNIINYLAVAMDITPLIQAQRAQMESEKIALDLVEKLRIADKNKNEFINMLSHELRNPLASIMMGIDLLEKAPPGGKQATMALNIAKRQGKQLANLVDDLLDATRITQNKVTLKKETIEINNLIDKVAQDYKSQFINKNVKLDVKLTLPLYIEADSSRLTQVIGNLLHNAVKFTSKNDLVMVSVTRDTITGEAVITVQDTGRGMEPKDQLNIFEPFMQVDKTLDRRLGGLGLGLSIVKGMVELHGGRVEAFSEGIGKGTKITIRLPL